MLEIPPHATAEEITAAYRRAAKRLHPDVPETGNRDAFQRLRDAYQVLGDPIRRADYDQSARVNARPRWRQEEQALGFVAPLSWRLPPYFGALLVLVTVLALGQVGWRLLAPSPASVARPVPTPSVTSVTPAVIPNVALSPTAPAPFIADHFIGPGAAHAVLSQRETGQAGYRRAGQLAPFTEIAVISPAKDDGLAEIRTAAGQTGFIEATRLLPGDARTARHAACLYNAGAPPRGGALLVRPAGGTASVTVENREDRPAVFKLRDTGNTVAAAIYLTPRGQSAIENLPPGTYHAEFAIGDLWSAPCGRFMAGMRARRMGAAQDLTGASRFTITAATVAEDISDDTFSRD